MFVTSVPPSPTATVSGAAAVTTDGLHLGYGERAIVENLSIDLPRGQITAIVGPNGCGKSTVLRSLARLLKPAGGTILLNGADIQHTRTKDLARQLAILPQSPLTPAGITVRELVAYGRFPHQGLLRSTSSEDRDAIAWALELTNLTSMTDREVDTLSGGERQRAWIAMSLAQKTDVLLLDEPTTYLDIHYQIEVLSLVRDLNHDHGITVGWVLHELNQAAAYSDKIVMLKGGQVVRQGDPRHVMTPDAIHQVFGIECSVIRHPLGDVPMCLPNGFCPLAGTRPRARQLRSTESDTAMPAD
jgi:ferric hydroxamate transport system ATP-binding protein